MHLTLRQYVKTYYEMCELICGSKVLQACFRLQFLERTFQIAGSSLVNGFEMTLRIFDACPVELRHGLLPWSVPSLAYIAKQS